MLVIKPFTSEYLEDAAALFTTNYQLLRKDTPLLPEKYQNQADVITLLENLVDETRGIVVLQDNKLVGYMSGFRIPYFKGTSYGVFCPEWGHAALAEIKTDLYPRMYKEVSRHWVANGNFSHAISFLAHEQALLDTFFWYGFGLLVIDAIRSLTRTDQICPADVTIKRAEPHHAPAIIRLKTALNRHLASPSTFLFIGEQERVNKLEKELAEESKKIWLALVNDNPVAFIQAEPSAFGAAQIVNDENTTSITGAYTLPEQRVRGIAVALLNEMLVDAADHGGKRCSVDFETANVEARHFWLTHFTPVCYSVIRHVDENIAWANTQLNGYTQPERAQS